MDTSRSPLEPSGFSRKLAATIIIVYMVVTLIPITWIVATSFKSVDSAISYPPEVFFEPSLEGYVNLFTNRSRQPQEYLDSLPPPETWYEELVRSREMVITGPSKFMGRYSNSLIIGFGATFLSVFLGALAAYAFSRYKFLGDKHLFFWLLTNRMAPPAVFALPFFQFYSSVNLFDTHVAVALSHCLFNIPLAVWILEGFMSAVPKELDETAYVDGYSFTKFFFKIFIPTITAGIGITMFFCFMFSWVELLLAKTLTAVAAKPIAATMTRTASTSGYELGLLAAAGSLTIVPGAIVIYFVRNYIAKGFALGRV